MLTFSLSQFNLAPRTAPRPIHQQQPDFDQLFDFDTFIYDAFYRNHQLTIITPPLTQLAWDFTFKHIQYNKNTLFRTFFNPIKLYQNNRLDKALIKSNQTAIRLFNQTITPFESPLPISHQNVLYTLQKNNKIEWINAWIDWHVMMHGVQAVIIYDNNSDHYDVEELIEKTKRSDNVVVIIIACPFKHGPIKWDGSKDDSRYLQTAMLEHVRYKYCHHNTKLLQCDIDEFVISKANQSIFNLCTAKNTVYTFAGHWIELTQDKDQSNIQHNDHQYLDVSRFCHSKWIANLEDMPNQTFLNIHGIHDHHTIERPLNSTKFLHFRCISTHWKYTRKASSVFKHDQFINLDLSKPYTIAELLF